MKLERGRQNEGGTVLVIVLWISFGLLVLAIAFAHSMSLELKGAQNRYTSLQAEHATTGAAQYVNYVLTTHGTNGILPGLTRELPEFRTTGAQVGACGTSSGWPDRARRAAWPWRTGSFMPGS